MPRRRRRSIFFYIWINQLKQRSRVFGEGGAVWSSVLAIALGKVATKEEEDGGEDRKGDRKEYYPSKRLRFASQYLFSFRFSYGKHPASLVATASQKGYQRLAAFFSDHPKILCRVVQGNAEIFFFFQRGGLDACSHAQHSIETAFRHKFIR